MTEKRDLLADKAICEAATKGPWKDWEFGGANMPDDGYWITPAYEEWDRAICSFGARVDEVDKANGKFIAAAREGWHHAIDRAIAAEAKNERIRKEIQTVSELSLLQDKLLACYRTSQRPSGAMLDRMAALREKLSRSGGAPNA